MWIGPPRLELQCQLLELAQQPLLPLPHMPDEHARRLGRQIQAQLSGLRDRPLGQLPGFHRRLGGDVASGLVDGVVQALGSFQAAILAREEGDGRVGSIRCQRSLQRVHLLVLPALGAVDDDEAPADREGHRVQGGGDVVRSRLVALEQLDALRAAG